MRLPNNTTVRRLGARAAVGVTVLGAVLALTSHSASADVGGPEAPSRLDLGVLIVELQATTGGTTIDIYDHLYPQAEPQPVARIGFTPRRVQVDLG